MRAVRRLNQLGNFRIGRNLTLLHLDEAVVEVHNLLVPDLHIQTDDVLSVGAPLKNDGVVPDHRVKDFVVGVAAEVHVNPVHPPSELLVQPIAPVRDEDHEVWILGFPDFLQQLPRFVFLDPELVPLGRARNRRRQRRPRVGESHQGHFHVPHLPDDVRVQHRLVPLAVGQVVGDQREFGQVNEVEQLILGVHELPVSGGHRVIANGVHDLHHRNALVEHRNPGPVPSVPSVQHKRLARFFGTQPLDHRGHMRHAADLALQFRLVDVVALAGLRTPRLDFVKIAVVERLQVGVQIVGRNEPDLLGFRSQQWLEAQAPNQQRGGQPSPNRKPPEDAPHGLSTLLLPPGRTC